ncbi:polysaccharide biosynthesis protein [Flavobacteriaceae bacterium LMO-SS05]
MTEYLTHKNILIFGTGPSGLMTYTAYKTDPSKSCNVLGFIDLNVEEEHNTFEDLRVYDIKDLTPVFITEKGIDEIVIAIQYIETPVLFTICFQLSNLQIPLKIIPQVEWCRDGYVALDQIKDLNIDDLVLRQPKVEYSPSLFEDYEHQIILITGAAGSIGSELARTLRSFNYKLLILMDSAESALYNLQQEFIQKGVSNFKAIVADIRDYQRMDQIFNLYKPKIVFHAAAYKHVPLMEEHPYEAVQVNVTGTKNVASLSVKHSVHKFILISTDKAVHPTNVMGASKRVAELYMGCLKEKGQTKFIITRFGNVLASNGSVIPLFKSQIEAGGPITLTHSDMKRYFMTISEASHLILESGAMGNGGELFVFEMGKPIKIYDLAVLMIKLSGHRFPEDIDIKISGLRPGEKVMEELLASGEQAKSTYHHKLKVAQSKPQPVEAIETKILELCQKASKLQNLELVAMIKSIVPEYLSNNSTFEVLDPKKT